MASIRKREWTTKSGTHVAWVVDYRDKDGKSRIKTFRREREAIKFRDETSVAVRAGIHVPDAESITLRDAVKLWIEIARDTDKREKSTITQYELHRDRYLCPETGGFELYGRPFADVKLSRLQTPHVVEFRDHLLKTASRAMAIKVLRSLKSVLKRAQERGKVVVNAAWPVKVEVDSRRSGAKIKEGREFPVPTEVKAIIAAAGRRWKPLLTTTAFTGLRGSELRGLAWDDVDLDRAVLTVRQRVDMWNMFDVPKSEAGSREIPLAPNVVTALREWKLACPRMKDPETCEMRLWLVFPNGQGRPESHANITNRGLYAAQIEAGITINRLDKKTGKRVQRPKYGLHALRHFFASWIIDAGFAPKRCQTLLGHSSIQLTYDRYGHLFPNVDGDATKLAAAARFMAD